MTEERNRYDFAITGGGAAGLSLALRLVDSPLRDKRILIVDRDQKTRNDRTWCFWSSSPSPLDDIAYRTWDRLLFVNQQVRREITLGSYQYRMIRGIDFYDHARRELARCAGVDFIHGEVSAIEDDGDSARLWVGGIPYAASWAFDSRFDPKDLTPDPARYYYLLQHFKGWEIKTSRPVFDPGMVTLFDFRTPQDGAMRFMYVLPFEKDRAMVEYTLFSPSLRQQHEYEQALRAYIQDVLGAGSYTILDEENGIIPMTNHPFQRRLGRRILAIGTRAGRVKPSSGYAFQRIQQDSGAIVRSLLAQGHPFDLPESPRRYRWFDAIMLHLMETRGAEVGGWFGALFTRNPVDRVFRFLDETGSPLDNLKVLASLPPGPFTQAALQLKSMRLK